MRQRMAVVPLLLVGVAAMEFAAFVAVAQLIGSGSAVLAVAAFSLVGLLLLRREGVRAWRRFRAAAEHDEPPGDRVIDGLVGLLGALLLAAPGFVSGLVGLLLLLPPVRWAARGAVRRGAERRVSSALAGDLFGPRRVRVRRGAPADPVSAREPVTAGAAAPAGEPGVTPTPVITGEILEGEIVDVRPRP